jgi:enoyl-CoA hydratase/carnithine racemase
MTVLVERVDATAVVSLNRPERLNAIGGSLLKDLHAALTEAASDTDVRAIVLRGEGRAFCAGDDLHEFEAQAREPETHIAAIQQITRDLMLSDKIVIGAAHGYAVGGGFEWLLNSDLVVAADDLVAFFPEMRIGQFVTGAVTHLLPLAVGHQRAMELLVLGERQTAARLHALGLVNWVVPLDELRTKAMDVAAQVAERSAFSVAQLKRLLTTDLHQQIPRALDLEQRQTIDAIQGADAADGARRFRQRREI